MKLRIIHIASNEYGIWEGGARLMQILVILRTPRDIVFAAHLLR